MATTNGELLSPSHSQHPSSKPPPSLGTKRKRRASSHQSNQPNGLASPKSSQQHLITSTNFSISDFCKTFLQVIQSHDPSPSVINRPILPQQSEGAQEPDAKRQKISNDNTIHSKLSSDTYTDIRQIKNDVRTVIADIVSPILRSTPSESTSTRPRPLQVQNEATIQALDEFRKLAFNILDQEQIRNRSISTERASDEVQYDQPVKSEIDAVTNGEPTTTELPSKAFNLPEGKAGALEVQMRSATGRTYRAMLKNGASDLTVKLPMGVTLPGSLRMSTAEGRKSEIHTNVPTLGEAFPTPSKLESIPFPQPSKITTTRSSQVEWYDPNNSKIGANRGPVLSHLSEPLPTARWIDYGAMSDTFQSISQEAKQRNRARTLSSGDARSTVPREDIDAQVKAKADAMFKSVFSSFAPTVDDAGAVVPIEARAQAWWMNSGESRLNRMLGLPLTGTRWLPSFEQGTVPSEQAIAVDPTLIDDSGFEEAVNSWDPDFDDLTSSKAMDLRLDKDGDEVLQETANLLETLHSHQRIRNLSLTSDETANGAPKSASSGTRAPKKPSEEEQNIHDILEARLMTLILSLPPYAVAKLNGDQLADLNISTKIVSKTLFYRGQFESGESASRRPVSQPSSYSRGAYSASMATPSNVGRPGNYPQASPNRSATNVSRPLVNNPSAYNPQRPSQHVYNTPTSNSYANVNGARQSVFEPNRYFQAQRHPSSVPAAYSNNRRATSTTPAFNPGSVQPNSGHQAQAAIQQQQKHRLEHPEAYSTPYNAHAMSPPRNFANQHTGSRITQPQLGGPNKSAHPIPAQAASSAAAVQPKQQMTMSPSPAPGAEVSASQSPQRQVAAPTISEQELTQTVKTEGAASIPTINGGDQMNTAED